MSSDDLLLSVVSLEQFSTVLSSVPIVVAKFYYDGFIAQQILPTYHKLSRRYVNESKIVFTTIKLDHQADFANSYGVGRKPTYMIFKNARRIATIVDPNPEKLEEFLNGLKEESENMDTTEAGNPKVDEPWHGAELPRGYVDVTDQVNFLGLELLNWDSSHGNARKLISKDKPLGKQLFSQKPSNEGEYKMNADTDPEKRHTRGKGRLCTKRHGRTIDALHSIYAKFENPFDSPHVPAGQH